MQNHVDDYLRRIRAKNYSKNTLRSRRVGLNKFLLFLKTKRITEPGQIKKNILDRYQVWLAETPSAKGKVNQVASQNTDLKAAKMFCRYLTGEDIIQFDPASRSSYARQPVRVAQSLSMYETKRLLDAPDRSDPLGYRDAVICRLAYAVGMRRGEFANLTLENVDLDEKVVYVREGKFLKDRTLPLGKAAVWLRNYIEKIRPQLVRDPAERHVFISQRGGKLAEGMFYIIVKKYGKQMGMKRKVYTHLWRSTCLTHCARNGMSTHHLMALAGHSNPNSLRPYLAHDLEDQRKALKQYHPMERGEI